MKVNYQKELDKELETLKTKKSLLLHVCCAPCLTYTFFYLEKYFDIYLYFVNDNIDTDLEFNKRLKEIDKFIKLNNLNIKVLVKEYNHQEFLDKVKGYEKDAEGQTRCKICMKERIDLSFKKAKELNLDYVTTTLTISPYKDSQFINEIGKSFEKLYNIKYLVSDFKKNEGYKKSIELSHKYELYRQDYCGCEYGD